MTAFPRHLTISAAALVLAAGAALAQETSSRGAENAEQLGRDAQDVLRRTAPGAASGQPGPSTGQPETMRILRQSGAQPIAPQSGARRSGNGSTLRPSVILPGDVLLPDPSQLAGSKKSPPTVPQIEAVRYDGGALPEGQSALTVVAQVLLDRAGISPGIIDGWCGGMSQSAIAAFESRESLPVDGEMDPQVWQALGGPEAAGLLQSYVIADDDVTGLSQPLPQDYAELAQLDRLGYIRVTEKLAERFHMDEDFLVALNPGADFAAGSVITVVDPGAKQETKVARIEVHKPTSRLAAFDAEGRMIANYPVTVGSSATPSPSGTVEVVGVALDPTYTYNPKINFKQGENDEVLILPPGPNGPVGAVWIDLSKPTYGLHGTSDPSSLFKNVSHGCVRLTNWDVEELAHLVTEGVVVEFIE